jgi:hypothetical protein
MSLDSGSACSCRGAFDNENVLMHICCLNLPVCICTSQPCSARASQAAVWHHCGGALSTCVCITANVWCTSNCQSQSDSLGDKTPTQHRLDSLTLPESMAAGDPRGPASPRTPGFRVLPNPTSSDFSSQKVPKKCPLPA